MTEGKTNNRWIRTRWVLLRLILMVYDVLAVNAAFILALLVRFYVAKEFHSVAANYIRLYSLYAPMYTVFCLVVFACFKLYNSMWKYAGYNDLNRLITANAVCFAGHVAGTLLFGARMPITFYCIGAVIQLCLIAVSRFSYRLLLVEKGKFVSNREAEYRAMVVGAGGTGRTVLKQLDQEKGICPVCVLDYKGLEFGSFLNGFPIVNGVENLESAIEKYQINFVILASTVMPAQIKSQIKEICGKLGVSVRDYSGFFGSISSGITLKSLAEVCEGSVELVLDGKSRSFDDCEQALMDEAGKYVVKSIRTKDDVLVLELTGKSVVLNDLNVEWVRNQQQETGEEISFF